MDKCVEMGYSILGRGNDEDYNLAAWYFVYTMAFYTMDMP